MVHEVGLHRHPGMGFQEGQHHRQQVQAAKDHGRRHAQRADGLDVRTARQRIGVRQRLQDAAGIGQVTLPRVRQPKAARGADQQARAKVLLQRGHLPGHGGGGHPDLARRPAKPEASTTARKAFMASI